jgi:DNA polymerase-3 subunit epsilon
VKHLQGRDMLREIVLDTETTGTEAHKGDRVIEIGCVELVNHCPTGRTWHSYLNPEYPVAEGAFNVHGLSNAFLADKPKFAEVADAFQDFIGDARLVIHNAAFDVGFLNAEFARLKRPPLEPGRVVDTLTMARRKHPGASNSLDALCQRYGISNAHRTRHGALLDSELLAEVYIELIGGKQADLGLNAATGSGSGRARDGHEMIVQDRPVRQRPRPVLLTAQDEAEHAGFIAGMGDKAIWLKVRKAAS